MIKKETVLFYAKDDDERILLSKIYDNYVKAREKNYNTYSDFISEDKKEILETIFKSESEIEFKTYGGYEGAERVISAFLANSGREDFPVSALEITLRNIKDISHRDILGSLMGLGIKRETVGDILIDKSIIVFVKREIADYIILNLTKVGRYPVSVDYYTGDGILKKESFEEITTTISSNRLDLILSAGFKIKRSDAVRYINQKRVSVTGRMTVNSDMRLKENDKIVLRGYGKMIYLGESGTSKKGKVIINIKRLV